MIMKSTLLISVGFTGCLMGSAGTAFGATLYFVGDAAIDQTSQGVRVTGEYSSNKFAIAGANLRYTF